MANKAPPALPVKAPSGLPSQSKTMDTKSHHTSPVKGPQAVDPMVVAPSKGAKITKIPTAPPAKYKHTDE